MARKPMVTRTLKSITVNALCVSVMNRETFEKEFTFPCKKADNAKLMKMLEKSVDSDTKPIDILSVEEHEELYGMSEEEFIKYAAIMPTR